MFFYVSRVQKTTEAPGAARRMLIATPTSVRSFSAGEYRLGEETRRTRPQDNRKLQFILPEFSVKKEMNAKAEYEADCGKLPPRTGHF